MTQLLDLGALESSGMVYRVFEGGWWLWEGREP